MAAAKTTKAQKTPSETRDNTPKDAYCVWIGPGIRGVIQYGQIFPVPRSEAREVLPEKIAALWDEGAGALVVGPSQLPAARLEVKKQGSALWTLARSIPAKVAGNKTKPSDNG